MLTTNLTSGLPQFANLLHNGDPMNLSKCLPTSKGSGSESPKSADENVSGGVSTTTISTSPSITPTNLNNNSLNSENNEIKKEPRADGTFDPMSLLAPGSLWANQANTEHPNYFDAAFFATMANQQLRDSDIFQLFNKHSFLQRPFGLSLPLRTTGGPPIQQSSLPSSSSVQSQPPKLVDNKSKSDGSQQGDKKRGYPYTFQYCVLCQKNVHSSKLPCHIRQCHVGKPMFQCPACDFTSTYSKNNVKSHMVSLHGITGDPISYMDEYAEQVEEFMKKCFPNVRGRARPFPGRSHVNGQSSATSRQIVKSRPRQPIASPKDTSEHFLSSQNGSHQSLLLPPQLSLFAPNVAKVSASLERLNGNKSIGFPNEEGSSPPEKVLKVEKAASPSKVAPDENSKLVNDNKSKITQVAELENDTALYTKYPHRFISEAKISGTVYETFTDSSDLIDRIDLTEVAEFFENNNGRLLQADQIKSLAEIRKQLPEKDFEIMFALYKCDTSLLSANQIRLIKKVAPSEVDARRFKMFCETNTVSSLTDEEKFIIELSNIEQLSTRLHVMEMTHSQPELIFSLHQEILMLNRAATALREDSFLATVLQCSTIYANFLCGDFGAQLIRGLRVADAIEVCNYQLPNGKKVARKVTEMLPGNALVDSVSKRVAAYKEASQYTFSTLEARVNNLCNGLLRVEAERHALGIESGSQNSIEEARLREALQTAQASMKDTLEFFAEKAKETKPESFLENVVYLLGLVAQADV